ncbi:MAG TPA: isochorismatase family protein [Pseudorhizobium sp.]|nr:isochorismatase family protein [Pseudorhizobium sp.]
MTVIPFPRSQGTPLFLFAHRPEWPHAPEQFYREWFRNCLVNASVALLAARRQGMMVAHAVPSRGGDRSTDVLRAGSGLGILRHESVFTFAYPSLFRNELLKDFLEHGGVSNVFLVGFSANDVALATAIDARSHGYRLTVMRDCSPLVALRGVSVAAADHVTFSSLATFCEVANFSDYLARFFPVDEHGVSNGPDAGAWEDETLRFFLSHLAEQAESLGHRVCARKLREAASDIFPSAAALCDFRSDR